MGERTGRPLTLAVIGCGARGQTYVKLMMEHYENLFRVVAAVDPQQSRREKIKMLSQGHGALQTFQTADEFLQEERIADMVLIATQDHLHYKVAKAALNKGYDILLEKPIATNPEDVLDLATTAKALHRRVMVCHVLRFAPLYQTIKRIVASGTLGEIVSAHATEGVGPWHFAHSYVRGHWRQSSESSPIILAKSCHDLDILSWIMDDVCISASSHGSQNVFKAENVPSGAPKRCTDGCPHSEQCLYNAERYADRERRWLSLVWDDSTDVPNGKHGGEAVREWLQSSPWGRCVWRCDNDQPDHQTAQFEFSRGQTATFTVTAFATGRTLELYGTAGTLRAGETIEIANHATGETQTVPLHSSNPAGVVSEEYQEHGGGDFGLISRLYQEITAEDPSTMIAGIEGAVQSHLMAFAAEESRQTGRTVSLLQRWGQVYSTKDV